MSISPAHEMNRADFFIFPQYSVCKTIAFITEMLYNKINMSK